jgi:hypothetical protein
MGEQSKSTDPAERFREIVTEWERGFDALANRFMGTDEFSRAMNQFQNLQLSLQKTVAEVIGRQLAAVNMPSRDDVLRIGEAIHELDMRVARMEHKLDEISRATGVEPQRRKQGPPRTKRPPSAVAS